MVLTSASSDEKTYDHLYKATEKYFPFSGSVYCFDIKSHFIYTDPAQLQECLVVMNQSVRFLSHG